MNLEKASQLATSCARDAGAIALDRFGTTRATRKADKSLVTEVDLQLQELILRRIAEQFPDHDVIAEEQHERPARAGEPTRYCWVVDPLDGTRNFVRGFPFFCVSIALLVDQCPALGVIHDPVSGRTYSALRGGGAFLNGSPILASNKGWHEDTLIGAPTGKNQNLPATIYDDWCKRAVLRNTGSTALHLALVACGALDACYAQKAKLWDIAAGTVLLEESGGVITAPGGQAIFPVDLESYRCQDLSFLAGGKTMHAELLGTLR